MKKTIALMMILFAVPVLASFPGEELTCDDWIVLEPGVAINLDQRLLGNFNGNYYMTFTTWDTNRYARLARDTKGYLYRFDTVNLGTCGYIDLLRLQMFRQTDVPILGLIENMSTFVCDGCSAESHPFGVGGGATAAAGLEIPFLGSIPLDPALRSGADDGMPAFLSQPDTPSSRAIGQIARDLAQRLAHGRVEGEIADREPKPETGGL